MIHFGQFELAFAGLVGAVVAIPFQEGLSTWKGRLFFVLTGIACSWFTAPLALHWYEIESGLADGVGFLLGAFGGAVISAALRAFKGFDLLEFIKGRLRPGGDE